MEHQLSSTIQLSSSIYSNTISGLIGWELDPGDSLYQNQNAEYVDADGLEFAVRFMPSAEFSAFANYTYQEAQNLHESRQITNSPPHMFKCGAWAGVLNHFAVGAQLHLENGRWIVYDTKTKPFALTDLQLTLDPKLQRARGVTSLLDRIKLNLKVRNVLDQGYAYPADSNTLRT